LQGSPLSVDEVHALLAVHDAEEWTQYEVVVSDSKPEDGIVEIRVAPIVYNRGKVTLESLIETSIPRIPVVTLSNPTASHSSWRPQSMTENLPPPVPALRSAPVPVMDSYDPWRPTMPTREEPPAALLDHDPYAPASIPVPPTSSWKLPDPYMSAPRGTSQSTPYPAITYASIGGVCAATGVAIGGEHGVDDPEFCQLRDILAESGHTGAR
jgi:hypothetical protein